MNNKILYLVCFSIFFFVISNNLKAQATPEGDYKVGDTKCTIKQDIQGNWRVYWGTADSSTSLKYKENMMTGEQVWVETKRGRVVGNFILNNDYTLGRYIRFSDDAKLDVVKIQ